MSLQKALVSFSKMPVGSAYQRQMDIYDPEQPEYQAGLYSAPRSIYRKEIRLACQIPISAGNEPFGQAGQQGEIFP